jgi:lipid II isoglutaminyl synthase (glutamine-hydrolysing)
MNKKTIYLTHLYPNEMAIYGDRGNLISFRDVLEHNGYEVVIQDCGIGNKLPLHTDWYFIGGGADKDQYAVIQDLQTKKIRLLKDLTNNIPLLAICGGYQLLGKTFVGGDKTTIAGLGWFDIKTEALDQTVQSRCVGNYVVEVAINNKTERLAGFENHGGQTYGVGDTFIPLGKVLIGFGNNSTEKLEGCIKVNTIGCYCHGPCLAKNPSLLSYFGSIVTGEELKIPQEYTELNQQLVKRFT